MSELRYIVTLRICVVALDCYIWLLHWIVVRDCYARCYIELLCCIVSLCFNVILLCYVVTLCCVVTLLRYVVTLRYVVVRGTERNNTLAINLCTMGDTCHFINTHLIHYKYENIDWCSFKGSILSSVLQRMIWEKTLKDEIYGFNTQVLISNLSGC